VVSQPAPTLIAPSLPPPVAAAPVPVAPVPVAPVPVVSRPVAAAPRPASPVPVYRSGPNVFIRSLRIAVVVSILIAIPTTVAYLAFHYAQGTPYWPLSITW
jgi:hypothetical protein